jgi:hypothetical protein
LVIRRRAILHGMLAAAAACRQFLLMCAAAAWAGESYCG